MNRKQLIIIWLMGILICLFILFAPKYYVTCSSQHCITWEKYLPGCFTKIKWYQVIQESLIVLIIGGLLVYSLREKK